MALPQRRYMPVRSAAASPSCAVSSHRPRRVQSVAEEIDLPSLDVVANQVATEREIMNSHAESLDSKAGVVLGFAGVLVGLGATAQSAVSDEVVFQVGLGFAVLAALLAAASFLPRRYPVLEVARLRQNNLTASVEETKLELLDTEILMVEQAAALVKQKGRGVRASVVALAGGAALVVAGTLAGTGGHAHV
jgi:hypothetical protein